MTARLWWLPIVGIFARYLAQTIVELIGARISPEDSKTLYETLTGTDFILGLVTALTMAGVALRSWLKLKREALTATAVGSTSTPEQIAALSKTSAPALSTPKDTVPQLTEPK